MPKNGRKSENTFKFQNFAERISNVKIDVYRTIGQSDHQVPENDKDTFFRENLERWAELNCSLHFTAFYRQVRRYVQSFNQLLYHKDAVIALLQQYLTIEKSLALEPCLDLLATLARDLLDDFRPYFNDFFTLLTGFLTNQSQNTALLEQTFVALARIFKFIWKYLVKDLENVFGVFKCILKNTQKQHIQSFAAESFAFLIRKSKQKQKVTEFLFQQADEDVSLCEGVGMLLFFTVKGVKEQLNFNAEDVLKDCLHLFAQNPSQQVFTSLTKLWSMCLHHTTPEHARLLTALPVELLLVVGESSSHMLKLLDQCMLYRDGKYVQDYNQLFEVIIAHVPHYEQHSLCTILTDITITFLKSASCHDNQLTQLYSAIVESKFIAIHNKLAFTAKLFEWHRFAELCEPVLLRQLAEQLQCGDEAMEYERVRIVEFLARLVHRGEGEDSFAKPFSLLDYEKIEFPSDGVWRMLVDRLHKKLWSEDLDKLWAVFVALYSVQPKSEDATDVLKKLASVLKAYPKENLNENTLFTLATGLNCFIELLNGETSTKIDLNWILELARRHPDSVFILDCLEHYCRKHPTEVQALNTKTEVFDLLKTNLSSPVQKLRLLTLMLLKNIFANEESLHIFDTCIEAESMQLTFHNYRDVLLRFQRLKYNADLPSMHSEIVLRVVLGNLYANLATVWQPLIEVASTYGEDLQLWPVFKEALLNASVQCCETSRAPCTPSQEVESLFSDHLSKTKSVDESRIDHRNFRILLLKTMAEFPSLVERKSREIIPAFVDFVQNEYIRNDEILSQTQDISQNEDEEDIEDQEDDSNKMDRKTKIKTLCAYLNLFKLFKNPKALYRESEIFDLHMEFLTSKDNEVQTLSLACLAAYKFAYLKPYQDNLDKLMNDATFRDELVMFSTGQALVKEEHKSQLIPVLIRLLYGKLQRKSGLGSSGKTNVSARRNVIMQFLSNCEHAEIKTFIDLILEPFNAYKDVNVTKGGDSTLDLSTVIPIRRQTGYLNMLSNVVTRLDKLAKPFLPLLFDTLLHVTWMASICLTKYKDEVHPSFVNRLKALRHLGTTKIGEVMERIVDFDYENYIEKIFSAAIWPHISHLSSDSIQNATPVFRLVVTLGANSRYQPLLRYEMRNNKSLLAHVYKMLKCSALSDEIARQIMTMTLNLLTMEDYNDKKNGAPLLTYSFVEGERIGIQLVRPFVGDIVDYLSGNLVARTKDLDVKSSKQKHSSKIIPHLQLSVLSHISSFVTDPEQCEQIVSILFPLLQCIGSEDTQVFVLNTVTNMLQHTQQVTQHLPRMPQLFRAIVARKPRTLLCKLYTEITSRAGQLQHIAKLVSDLNAWDAKRLDEPDYDLRLAAFRTIGDIFSGITDVDEVAPIVCNALHIVATTEDISLRDASASCLEKIVQLIANGSKPEWFTYVVQRNLLPAIRHGFKSKNEIARFEFVGLLTMLVKCFDEGCLADLKKLSSDDAETCFFQNIRHIQIHRRVRAIHQVTRLCAELSPNTLFVYILPLISHVIFDSLSSTKDHNLLSETITAIGNIMKCLPWGKYALVLKNYLNLLKKEKRQRKTITRMVVSILNNFHFEIEEEVEENSQEEQVSEEKNQEVSEEKDQDPSEENIDDEEENEGKNEKKKENNILKVIVNNFLPTLQRFMKKHSRKDSFHKHSHNKEEDDEDIMKIPIALAVVKLLQRLPAHMLKTHLPGLLLRVSQSLRSQARDVREVARDTMLSIAVSLGPKYLSVVLKEMRSVLLRGYQLHVLGYTIHTLLEGVQPQLTPGDLDASVELVMEILMEELFGSVNEEKDVAGITTKLHEAKSRKSIESISILSQYISTAYLTKVLSPLQELLNTTVKQKEVHKIEEALRLFSTGVQHNKSLSVEDYVLFIHGMVSNTLSKMLQGEKQQEDKQTHPDAEHLQREDIFIVPKAPSRSGKTPGVSRRTNEHIVVEFGLQLLHTALKRQKLTPNTPEHAPMIDSLVKVIQNSLSSKYVKIVVLSARCLSHLVKFDLPTLHSTAHDLARQLFKILKKYSRNAGERGDNFDLVASAFKAMTVFIREYTEFDVNTKQLRILLSFVEEDIHNPHRRSTALPLLKAILSRKLLASEIHQIMTKVCELSVRDHDETTRRECRQLMSQYLLDYPLGKKISTHFNFYVTHLTYEEVTGRRSVLEMLALMFNTFPSKLIQEHCAFFFIPLVMMLANDDAADCRKMAAVVVKGLLRKVDAENLNELFAMVMQWSGQEKPLLRQVAVQCIGIFVEIESESFDRRLDDVIGLLENVLTSAVATDDDVSENEDDEEEQAGQKSRDKLLYNSLTCLGKMFSVPALLMRNEKYSKHLLSIWESLSFLLLHPHSWIRLAVSQLFSLYFASFTPQQIVEGTCDHDYLAIDTKLKIKELCYGFCSQLQDENITQQVSDQATKNLIFLTKVVLLLDDRINGDNNVETSDNVNEDETDGQNKIVTLKSLVTRMCQLAAYENSHNPKNSIKRTCAFRWIASLCLNGGVNHYLIELLRPLHREVTSPLNDGGEMYQLAQEVFEMVRSSVDKDDFAQAYNKLQKKLSESREERKRKNAEEAVSNPQKFAKRKQKENLAKREQRKRKLHEKKPDLKFKKIRSKEK